MAAKTQFTAKQVADGMGFLAMAGMDATKIVKAMPQALQLASAGMIDVADASNIVTNVMAGMGLEMEELARANDTIVSAITGSNVDVRMLGESFRYVGPVAKAAGISFEEITAALGKLGNAGIQGSMAGTTLRAAISRLLAPSEAATKMLDQFGVQILNADGSMKSLEEIIGAIEFSGLAEGAAGASRMMEIFGMRAGPGMQALVSQGSHSLGVFKARLEGAAGTAERISKMQLNTLTGKFKILGSAISGLAIDLGQRLIPATKAVVVAVTSVVDWFRNWSDAAKNAALSIPVLTTLILGLTAALKGLFLAISTGALKRLAISFGAILVPVLAVAAAVFSVLAVIGTFSKAWKNHSEMIKSALVGIKTGFINTWKDIVKAVTSAWDTILSTAGSFLKTLDKALFKPMRDMVLRIMGKMNFQSDEMIEKIIAEADKAGGLFITDEAISEAKAMIDDMSNAFGETADTLLAAGSLAADGAKKVGKGIWGGMKELGDSALEGAKLVGEKLMGTGIFDLFGTIGKGGAPGGAKRGLSREFQLKPSDMLKPIEKQFVLAGQKLEISTDLMSNAAFMAGEAAQEFARKMDTLPDIAEKASGAWKAAALGMAEDLLMAMGEFGSIAAAAKEGFAQGGPWGALVAAFAALVKKTESFATVVRMLDTTIASAIPVLNMVIAPLTMLLKPFMVFANLAMALVQNIGLLGVQMKGWGKVIGWVSDAFVWVMEKAVAAINWMLEQAARFVAKINKGWAKSIRDAKINWVLLMKDLDNAIAPPNVVDQVNDLGTAAAAAAEALHNIPEGYKIALEQFRATEPMQTEPYTAPTGLAELARGVSGEYAAARSVIVNVEGSGDPIAVAEEVARIIDEQESDKTGTLRPLDPIYAVDPGI
jgi:TP901 family phage tail tape measure protein